MLRARLENWLNQVWYQRSKAPLALRMLEPLYRHVAAYRAARDKKRQPADLVGMPIVVVGNITAGGTGKTPLVIRLCELIRQAGFTPGVVSRGYGVADKGFHHVKANSDPAVCGDEPVLIARRASASIIVSPDRTAAARKLFSEGVHVVISDDGLQHHRLPRAMEICVVDIQRELGNGRQLPAGPLREPPQRLKTVDHVILNGVGDTPLDGLDGTRMSLSPLALKPLNGHRGIKVKGLGERLQGVEVHAFAGIGNPQRFFDQLAGLGIEATDHPMPDHHEFVKQDFSGISSSAMIIMTEKDAVKCTDLKLPNAWYMPVRATLPAEWEEQFSEQITSLVNPEETGGDMLAAILGEDEDGDAQ
jgi:tetraacyldisaccharide 4'-kinase